MKDDLSDVCKVDTSNSHAVTSHSVSCMCLWMPLFIWEASSGFNLISSFLLQGECNGSLSIPENHLLEVEASPSRSLSKISKAMDEHMLYDFGDEQVRLFTF